MVEHTKGPWMAAAKPSSIVGWPVVSPADMGRSICSVTIHDQAEANAKLIAAAPEMLSLLYQYKSDLLHPVTDSGSRTRRLEAIDRVISRATGKVEGQNGG